MRFNRIWILLLLLYPPRSAHAQAFVGPNIEWNHWTISDPASGESGNVFAAGGVYLMPGLRVGYVFSGGLVARADAGVQIWRLPGFLEYTNVLVEPGLEYAFLRESATSPYAGVSLGWYHVNIAGDFSTAVIGGSVGVRHRVAAGHGFIRGEVRYDHLTEKDKDGYILPDHAIGIRLGADLLFSR